MIFTFHSLCIFVCYAYKLIRCRRRVQPKKSHKKQICDSAMDKRDSDDLNVKKIINNVALKDDKSVATDPAWSNEPVANFGKEEGDLKFIPPVYIQRYSAVVEVLNDARWKDDIKKVVDMGCAELSFFQHLKSIQSLTQITCVDIDIALLEYYSCKTSPLTTDYLKMRDHDVIVSVFAGSVAEYDKSLEKADAVVCIELIEHLYPPELEALPHNIFGQVRPRIAVFTTPNSDFNVLFPNLGSGFRHDDHKFEWTREQFNDWAQNLVIRYPDYKVEIQGVGPGPEKTLDTLGCCSQMAVFWREPSAEADTIEPSSPPHKMVRTSEYKLIQQSVFPAKRDERPPELKAQHEAEYTLYQLSRQERFEDESGDILVPLSVIMKSHKQLFLSEEQLLTCLEKAGWRFRLLDDGSHAVIFNNRTTTDNEDEDEEEEEEEDVDAVRTHWQQPQETWEPWASHNGEDSDWEMGDATPRPWQSEPHLQASCSPQSRQQPPEALMFRSVNEKQIFGYRASSPEDAIRIDDSGYPNSASVQDMDVTLGSSDELSNSPQDDLDDEEEDDLEEDDMPHPPPRLPSPPPPHFPPDVNNHDAMNNNRDYEGNDLGLEVPHQPLPRPRPPPFPRWLLLLLAEERDEGFEGGSSSSEEEDEEDRHVL